MTFSEEELDYITRLSAAGFSAKETAIVIEADIEEFITALGDEQHPAMKAYFKGYYSSLVSIRERVMKDAANGSSPAQTLAAKIIEETQIKNMNDGISAR